MILGLSCSHNATVCLLDERAGRVVYCASEERFTRRKQEWGFPRQSLRYALERVVRPEAIVAVAVGESCRQQYGSRKLAELVNLAPYEQRDALCRHKVALAALLLDESLGRLLGRRHDVRALLGACLKSEGIEARVYYYDHHQAHAASAFYACPFPNALVATLDGEGDGCMGSFWKGRGTSLTELRRYASDESLGLFYKLVTALLGYRVNRDEGKVMALASRGNPWTYYTALAPFLGIRLAGGAYRVESPAAALLTRGWSRHHLSIRRVASRLSSAWGATAWEALWNAIMREEAERLFAPLRLPSREDRDLAWQADFAAAAQKRVSECVLALVGEALGETSDCALAAAGGLFANVCVNHDLLCRFPGVSLYVHPGMGDEGLAFGAAALQLVERAPEHLRRPMLHDVYLGPAPTHRPPDFLPAHGAAWEASSEERLQEVLARALAAGRIIGICRGPMEYGPRALGHRSILAHPGLPHLPAALNRRLGRSPFMPFAPAVLSEYMEEIFEGRGLEEARWATPFMTVALPVRPVWRARLAAVVHEDGTARPQRIDAGANPFLHGLVERFSEETGLGCVLNTSFNHHGEPIVRTGDEAFRAWQAKAVDILVLGRTCYAMESLERFGTRTTTARRDRRPA